MIATRRAAREHCRPSLIQRATYLPLVATETGLLLDRPLPALGIVGSVCWTARPAPGSLDDPRIPVALGRLSYPVP